MVAQFVGHLSSTDLQKQLLLQATHRTNPSTTAGAWMWAGRPAAEEDDSWADRAFAEDTGNIMGTTWPPRSYTCTFCRREFRSAQALGGHMNVHRRDRARMHQSPPSSSAEQASLTASLRTPPVFTAQELVNNGGLCLFYPFPAHGHVYQPHSPPSTLLSISPYAATTSTAGHMPPSCSPSIPLSMLESSLPAVSKGLDGIKSATNDHKAVLQFHEAGVEELDLELRLGNKRS